MTIDDAVNHFGSNDALAKKLGITTAAISMWRARGGAIPLGVQYRIQVLTKGRLKADQPSSQSA
jgi:transcriptional repressor of cell division inhibition gene dicB